MFRVGIGFDTHRFAPDRELVLGGIIVPYKYGLDGWSDADVLCHAIADACLGAAAAGDIGRHFPPKDSRWKDASSIDMLRRVREIVNGKGFEVVNIDSVLMMEDPKVSEHRGMMCEKIGQALGIDESQVGVKATTTEKLGYVGRGEGASAQAVALLRQQTKEAPLP